MNPAGTEGRRHSPCGPPSVRYRSDNQGTTPEGRGNVKAADATGDARSCPVMNPGSGGPHSRCNTGWTSSRSLGDVGSGRGGKDSGGRTDVKPRRCPHSGAHFGEDGGASGRVAAQASRGFGGGAPAGHGCPGGTATEDPQEGCHCTQWKPACRSGAVPRDWQGCQSGAADNASSVAVRNWSPLPGESSLRDRRGHCNGTRCYRPPHDRCDAALSLHCTSEKGEL